MFLGVVLTIFIPLIVGIGVLAINAGKYSHPLVTMAGLLTVKPVVFIVLSIIVSFIAGSSAGVYITGAAIITSLVIAVLHWKLLVGSGMRIEAWLLLLLDGLRTGINTWATYSFNVNETGVEVIGIFLMPTVYAIIAVVIMRNEHQKMDALKSEKKKH